jgi:hypothetical protein
MESTVAPLKGDKRDTTSVNHLADRRTKLSLVHCHPTCGADTMPHGNMHRREHQELCSRANPDGDREHVFIPVEITGTTNKPSGQGQDKGRVPPPPKMQPYRDARTKTKAKAAQSCPPGLSGNGYPERRTLSIPSMH